MAACDSTRTRDSRDAQRAGRHLKASGPRPGRAGARNQTELMEAAVKANQHMADRQNGLRPAVWWEIEVTLRLGGGRQEDERLGAGEDLLEGRGACAVS